MRFPSEMGVIQSPQLLIYKIISSADERLPLATPLYLFFNYYFGSGWSSYLLNGLNFPSYFLAISNSNSPLQSESAEKG